MMVEGGELMPTLVVHDGVCPLNGDILLKQTLAFVASGYIDMDTLSNWSNNMCMVILRVTTQTTC